MTQHLYLLQDLRPSGNLNRVLGLDPDLEECRNRVNVGDYAGAIAYLCKLMFGNGATILSDMDRKRSLDGVWKCIEVGHSEGLGPTLRAHAESIEEAAKRENHNPRRCKDFTRETATHVVDEERRLCIFCYKMGRVALMISFLCSEDMPPFGSADLENIEAELV